MLRSALRRTCASTAADTVYDVLVVGGGVMGVWTAIAAAKQGATVVLADQFEPAHDHGSSHGDGRIYRLAYSEEHYVDMMVQSLPLWHELQDHAKEKLMATTGGINICDGSAEHELDSLGALYARRGFAHEWLSAGEVNERFPQFSLKQTSATRALFQPDYGVLFASQAVAAAWQYASHLGVATLPSFRVSAVHGADGRPDANASLVVESDDGTPVRAKAVVLALGSWTSATVEKLFGLAIPTRVTAETVCYYAPLPGVEIDHSYRTMPVFIPEVRANAI